MSSLSDSMQFHLDWFVVQIMAWGYFEEEQFSPFIPQPKVFLQALVKRISHNEQQLNQNKIEGLQSNMKDERKKVVSINPKSSI
jgi:hypothetical protein